MGVPLDLGQPELDDIVPRFRVILTEAENHLNGLAVPMLLLSGIMLPMSFAPKWLQLVSDANPLKHVVEGARAIFRGDFMSSTSAWGLGWGGRSLSWPWAPGSAQGYFVANQPDPGRYSPLEEACPDASEPSIGVRRIGK